MHLGELCHQVSQELEDASPLAVFQREEKGDLSGFWDPDRLAQVLSNLLGNAVQHGSRGTPVGLEADGTDPGRVRVRVENSGAVPPELIPTLFDAFQRASEQSSSLAPRGTGLGLGLFIAREIARAHGGEITVTTEDDRTRFEVALPRDARPPIAAPVR
jgi:signal transduction histidine kinase